MYTLEENVKWLCKDTHTHTHRDEAVLLTNTTAWTDFYTHSFATVGIVNGEVVYHLGVYRCHGYNRHLVNRLIPHWSSHCDDGTVFLHFNCHQWWPKTSYKTKII